MIIITQWVGGIGSNIQQVINAIFYALYYGHNRVRVRGHKYIKSCHLGTKTNKKVIRGIFINRKGLDLKIYKKKLNKKLLLKFWKYNIKPQKSGENDLVIHIRSGDVYKRNPHSGWIQPPLKFYEQIIESKDWDAIYLICQDQKSPIKNPLLNKYKNIKWEKQSLAMDISYILGARNIIFGMGSFIPSLLLFNKVVSNIYYPKYCYRYLLSELNCTHHIYKFEGYIKKGKWRNTAKQKRIMLNFKEIELLK